MKTHIKNFRILNVIVLFCLILFHCLFSCDDCKEGYLDTPTPTCIATTTPTLGAPDVYGPTLIPLLVGNRWVYDYSRFWSYSSPDYSDYSDKQGTVTVEITEYGYFYEKNAYKIKISSVNAIGNRTVYIALEDGKIFLKPYSQYSQYSLFLPDKIYFGTQYTLLQMFHFIEKEVYFQNEVVVTVPAGEYNAIETECKENIFDPDSIFGGDSTYKQNFVRKLGLIRSSYEENFYNYNAQTSSHISETFSLVETNAKHLIRIERH